MAENPVITEQHVEVLRHTLGADSGTPGFRNFFNPGGEDVRLCHELALCGLMEPYQSIGGETFFRATKAGIAMVLRPSDIKRMERDR